jgi:hypothetical protein
MPAERIYFLQLGVGFLEHPKLDIAVPSAQVQLIGAHCLYYKRRK